MVSAGEGTESKRSRDGRERMRGEGGGEGERERSELKKCLDHLSYSSVVSFDFFGLILQRSSKTISIV